MSNQPHRPRTSPAPESSKTPDRVDFVFRVFISGKLHAEVRVQVEEEVKPTFEALAQEVIALGAADDHMIEVEDLTEPEPEQRFFRVRHEREAHGQAGCH